MLRLMQRLGHTCDEANDGRQAVDIVAKAMKESIVYHAVRNSIFSNCHQCVIRRHVCICV
jgi:hypothetical protein